MTLASIIKHQTSSKEVIGESQKKNTPDEKVECSRRVVKSAWWEGGRTAGKWGKRGTALLEMLEELKPSSGGLLQEEEGLKGGLWGPVASLYLLPLILCTNENCNQLAAPFCCQPCHSHQDGLHPSGTISQNKLSFKWLLVMECITATGK